MNCKPGDLAVVVRSVSGNLGKVVRVRVMINDVEFIDGSKLRCWTFEGPTMFGSLGRLVTVIPDECLRPLRDNPGQDETLTWAGLPNKQEQPA